MMIYTIWKQKCCFWLTFWFFANDLYFINTANILGIFPSRARSHFMFNRQIMYSLLEAGHHVTFVSDFQEPNPPTNFTYIVPKMSKLDQNIMNKTDFKSLSTMQYFHSLRHRLFSSCFDVMEIPEIQNFMNSDSKIYDILFVELVPAYECYIPLAEKFKIPVIGTLSSRPWMHTSDVFGDLHPLSIPTLWSPLPKKMSFFQRLENIIQNAYASLLIKYIWEAPLSDFLDQYFPDFDLKRHRAISLIFTINHVSVLATPLIPKVVEVTGIHLPPVKPLPQMIEKFINESENGVILLSFGSIANSNVIDSRLRNIFRDTFSCIQQRVIWKFDKNIERISENVLVSDWIPQSDILAHKNVKLFITHTGIKGMYEAIDAGVPLVCIPLFWDQPSNAGLIEDIGAGIRLDLKTLTKEILLNAINNILFDERYSKKMQKLSSQFKDRPMSPQQSVIYWTEYVLRHNGTQHLQPTSVEIPWHQYLLLDVIFFISFVVFTFSSMLWLIFKLCSKIWKSIKN